MHYTDRLCNQTKNVAPTMIRPRNRWTLIKLLWAIARSEFIGKFTRYGRKRLDVEGRSRLVIIHYSLSSGRNQNVKQLGKSSLDGCYLIDAMKRVNLIYQHRPQKRNNKSSRVRIIWYIIHTTESQGGLPGLDLNHNNKYYCCCTAPSSELVRDHDVPFSKYLNYRPFFSFATKHRAITNTLRSLWYMIHTERKQKRINVVRIIRLYVSFFFFFYKDIILFTPVFRIMTILRTTNTM